MSFLIPFFGTLLGLLAAVITIILIIYFKVRSVVGKSNMKSLTNAMRNAKNLEKAEYSRVKDARGMTTLLEEAILQDFPDFNKDLLFSLCQSNLTKIFNCLEERSISRIAYDEDLSYIKDYVSEQIEDMISNNITERYDSIVYNRHAISSYIKKGGKATIKVSTTLSYYYDTNRKDKKSFPDVKKETRYTSEFVYVYDEAKFNDKQVSFSVHCPNCGAPLDGINSTHCKYCSSPIQKINLKIWKMSSYKEDYK